MVSHRALTYQASKVPFNVGVPMSTVFGGGRVAEGESVFVVAIMLIIYIENEKKQLNICI